MPDKLFSPFFATMNEAMAWHPKEHGGGLLQIVYQTRTRKRWRARWTFMPDNAIYSRDALILVSEP